jgi:hypothetical protein
MGSLQRVGRDVEQLGRPVHVPATFAAARNFNALKDLGLQGGAEPLRRFDASRTRGLLELRERADAERLVELEDLVRPQPRHRQHFEHPPRGCPSASRPGLDESRFREAS